MWSVDRSFRLARGRVSFLCAVIWLVGGGILRGQEDLPAGAAVEGEPAPSDPPGNAAETAEAPTLRTLASVIESMELVAGEIDEQKRLLSEATLEPEKAALAEGLAELESRMAVLEADFEAIATGIDPATAEGAAPGSFDLKSELDELLLPLVEELKSMTEKPRVIERLRKELERSSARRDAAAEAVASVNRLRQAAEEGSTLWERLDDEAREWSSTLQQLENRMESTRFQLDKNLSERKPLIDAARSALVSFFRTRGVNLFLALAVGGGVFFLLRLFYRRVRRLFRRTAGGGSGFYRRLLDVCYQGVTILAAVSAALFVLYSAGDWVLLGFSLIVLVGLALTAKTGLTRFYEQARLLLNLGDVREGERVVYRGLPWRVRRLHFYTILENPALAGGHVRLPLAQLPGMNSRPARDDEPWFPSQRGDWVMLADGVEACVLRQTPELVQLKLRGGSIRTYPAVDYLKQCPEVLSGGFRIRVPFGIDYRHQAESTTSIPAMLTREIGEGLRELLEPEQLRSIRVEFAQAGASSLDYAILADFTGAAAPHAEILRRAIPRLALDSCNRHGWTIPFTQVTVHRAEG